MRCYGIRGPRKFDEHHRTHIRSMFNTDRSAMVANNFAHDSQSQPSPIWFSGTNERVENFASNALRHAGALVRDADLKEILHGLDFDGDSPIRIRGCFAGI